MNTIMSIDLGKFKSVVCFYEVKSSKHRFVNIETTPQAIHDLVVANPVDMIVFEACDIIGWICDLLDELHNPEVRAIKYAVANTNSPEFSGKRLKKKTDKNDALMLARRMALGNMPVIYVPKKEVREKRSFINHRHGLVERITQVKNSIRSILNRHADKLPAGKKGWSQKSIVYLKSQARPADQVRPEELWRLELYFDLIQFELMQDQLKLVEDKLAELNNTDKSVQLLLTAPAVGARTAEAVAAYIDDPHRFKDCKQVGSYIGMTPRQYQSGQTDRHGRISKDGNRLLRSLLVEVCWLGLRHNPWIRATYERIRRGSKTRAKIAIVAVARQLFVRLWAMLRDGKPWQMPELPQVAA